jgi:hypothetical protein
VSRYTYYFGDTLTGQILGDLPFSDVSLEWVLSGSGSFSGKLKLTDPDVVAQGALTLAEGRHSIYVDRDGVLIWSGIVWETSYDSSSASVTVAAADYWSWFSRRLARNDIDLVSARDEDVVAALLTSAFDGANPANLAYSWEAQMPLMNGGVDMLYDSTERKTVAEMIEARTTMAYPSGLDFRLDTYWGSSSLPQVTLVLGRPRLGRTVDSTGAFFDLPGNLTRYSRSGSAATLTGRLYVKGSSDTAGDDEVLLDDSAKYAGMPRYERAESVQADDPDALPGLASNLYARRNLVTAVYTFETRADAEPAIHRYRVGDYVRMSIRDARHPTGYDTTLRIGHITLTPKDEKVSITPWSDPDASS